MPMCMCVRVCVNDREREHKVTTMQTDPDRFINFKCKNVWLIYTTNCVDGNSNITL
jgi:hypothetical protein